jgi:hypothetical protein
MCCSRNADKQWERLLARHAEEDRLRELAEADQERAEADEDRFSEREPEPVLS